MQAKTTRLIIGFGLVLLTGALLLTVGIPALAKHSPASEVASLQAQTVDAGSVSVDLCAKAGSLTMPDGVTVDTWGFAFKPAGVVCTDVSVEAQVPGPTLRFDVGTQVTVTLHNALSEHVAISFPGQELPPDPLGAPPAGTATYAFEASRPGTYLYESGTLTGTAASIQVAMGLYGPLVVDSARSGTAYGTPETAYGREAVLVLSEIDPVLNADPSTYNFLDYKPTYWLINGKAYPETEPLGVSPGQRLLLRYVNASLSHNTMTLLGEDQGVIAKGGYPLNHAYEGVSHIIPAGQTWDTIVTAPDGANLGDRYALYNRNWQVTNAGDYPGGMMTFVVVEPYELYLPIILAGPSPFPF